MKKVALDLTTCREAIKAHLAEQAQQDEFFAVLGTTREDARKMPKTLRAQITLTYAEWVEKREVK